MGNHRTPQARRPPDRGQVGHPTKLCRPEIALHEGQRRPKREKRKRSIARVYVQVPYHGTEFDDAQTRGAQADPAFQPDELEAYRTLSDHPVVSTFTPKFLGSKVSVQELSGFVPGGFLILVVWERVTGIPLGDTTGQATGYWNQPKRERQKIREAFKKTFQ